MSLNPIPFLYDSVVNYLSFYALALSLFICILTAKAHFNNLSSYLPLLLLLALPPLPTFLLKISLLVTVAQTLGLGFSLALLVNYFFIWLAFVFFVKQGFGSDRQPTKPLLKINLVVAISFLGLLSTFLVLGLTPALFC